MAFCERCKNLVDFIRADLEASKNLIPGVYRQESNAIFRLDIKVSLGCSLCALIFDQISEDTLTELLQLADPFVNVRSMAYYSNPMHPYRDGNVEKRKPIWNSLELSFHHPQGRDLFKYKYPVSVLVENASDTTIQHPLSSNTDSPSSWQLARAWLKQCRSSHHCELNIDRSLPSRLIHLAGISRANFRARLVLSSDLSENMEYCTLSHCWGGSPMFKLPKANFVGFLSDIPIDALSKTFQDAVYAAIQLGFCFIWIDSLCIIQDVRDDWLQQASFMSSVYANSSLNLAATAAADGRGGLFFKRNPASSKANYIPASTSIANRYVIVNRRLWDQSIEEGPLAKRAWVVQERFLAPRTLHFASNQLFWECGRVSCCEMFPSMGLKDLYLPAFPGSRLKDRVGKVRRWTQWRSIVEHYSRASLTKEEDKLFAMAGLALNYHSSTGSTYLAGLWQEGIEKQLLWSSIHGLKSRSRQQPESSGNTRPSEYRAPSWSWASINGPISNGRWMGEEFDNVSIRVLAANIKLLREDQPFGGIQSASLTIECGQLKRTLIEHGEIWLPAKPKPIFLSHTADIMPVKLTEPIFLLLVDPQSTHFDIEHQKKVRLEGLMIIPTHTRGTYERFGHFRIPCTSGETQEVLSLESYFRLPGIEDSEAYEKTIQPQGDAEFRYVINLI